MTALRALQPRRSCAALTGSGAPCRAAPLRDGRFCRMHDPEHSADVAEARRLGGQRRRREVTVAGAYEFEGLNNFDDILRVLEIATFDTLALPNSIARSRSLAYTTWVAIRAIEARDLEASIRALRAVVDGRGYTPR
ncbi:MAG: hypothetical protein R3C39_10535 [Dehalococcoidia bacterium]